MLISDILNEIISEVGQDTSDSDVQTLFLGFIKAALRKLPQNTRDRCLLTTGSVSIASGAYSGSLPSDFLKERDDHSFYYLSDGGRKEVEYPERSRFNSYFNSNSSGSPCYCSIVGKTLEVEKKVDAAYTIYIEHFKSIWNVALGDTFAGNDNLVEGVKELVKFIYYHDYEEDKDKGITHLKMAQIELQELDDDFMIQECGTHVEEA